MVVLVEDDVQAFRVLGLVIEMPVVPETHSIVLNIVGPAGSLDEVLGSSVTEGVEDGNVLLDDGVEGGVSGQDFLLGDFSGDHVTTIPPAGDTSDQQDAEQ